MDPNGTPDTRACRRSPRVSCRTEPIPFLLNRAKASLYSMCGNLWLGTLVEVVRANQHCCSTWGKQTS